MSPYSHTATHRMLAGPRRAGGRPRLVGTDLGDNATPPCFLVQAEDDPVSDPQIR
jgi:hypothetical protein